MQEHLKKYCALTSRENGEFLCGTAPYYQKWILLEYRRPWRKKAVEDNELPADVRAHLAQVPAARLLFIRREDRRGPEKKLFIVELHPERRTLWEFSLKKYRDLLDIDLSRPERSGGAAAHRRIDPLYLVCTNGKRDKCCAKFGLPLYQALGSVAGDAVWQCTHMGGHRFAPTMLIFPAGVALGRVAHVGVGELVAQIARGEVPLAELRGRVFYPGYVQAAEYYLMKKSGNSNPDHFTLCESREVGEGRWQIKFRDHHGRYHELTVEQYFRTPAVLSTCDVDKPKPLAQFRLIDDRFYMQRDGREAAG